MSHKPTRIDFDKLEQQDPEFTAWRERQAKAAQRSRVPRRVRSVPHPQAEPERDVWGVWLMWALVVAVVVVGVVMVIEMV